MLSKSSSPNRSLIDAVMASHGIVFAEFVPERSLRRRVAEGVLEKICPGVYLDALRSDADKSAIVRKHAFAIACSSSPSVILAGTSAASTAHEALVGDTVHAVRAKPGSFSAYGVSFQFGRAADWHSRLAIENKPARPGVPPVRKLSTLGICLAAGHSRAAAVHRLDQPTLRRLYLQALADPAFPIRETVTRLGLDYLCASLLAKVGSMPAKSRPAIANPEFDMEIPLADSLSMRLTGNGDFWIGSGGSCGGQHYIEDQLFPASSVPGLGWLADHIAPPISSRPGSVPTMVGLALTGQHTTQTTSESDSVLRAALFVAGQSLTPARIIGPYSREPTYPDASRARTAICLTPGQERDTFAKVGSLSKPGAGLAYEYHLGNLSERLKQHVELGIIFTMELLAPHYQAALCIYEDSSQASIIELPLLPGRPDTSLSMDELEILAKDLPDLKQRADVRESIAMGAIARTLMSHDHSGEKRTIGRILPPGGVGTMTYIPLLGGPPLLGSRLVPDAKPIQQLRTIIGTDPDIVTGAISAARRAITNTRFSAAEKGVELAAEAATWLLARERTLDSIEAWATTCYTPNRHHGPLDLDAAALACSDSPK